MKIIKILILIGLFLSLPSAALAQDAEYRLDLNRDFGYGAGMNIRGSFSNRVYGPEENIASVRYLIDGEEMGVVDTPPFVFKYHTDSYTPGRHAMTAVVTTKDGREVTTPAVQVNLLNAAGEQAGMQKIFIPILLILAAVTVVGVAAQFLMSRRSGPAAPGKPRNYGFKGGTICPRCGRAYALHFLSVNLGPWLIDRCDYCGKVALVRRRSPAELAAAEQSESSALQTSEHSLPGAHTELSDEERARKMLDDFRYVE